MMSCYYCARRTAAFRAVLTMADLPTGTLDEATRLPEAPAADLLKVLLLALLLLFSSCVGFFSHQYFYSLLSMASTAVPADPYARD